MAISDSQKVDYLWKKLGYGKAKTDVSANKHANNESIASPILMRGGNVWAQSDEVPTTLPASSTNLVTVYPTTNPVETTADGTATLNRTWTTGHTDWIPPEFGSTYAVKIYLHTSGDAANAASSGLQLFAAGSENNDEWFFDYQAGVLHFMGENLPHGANFSGKSIYVSGGRYTGIQGVTELNGIGIATGPHDLNVQGTLVGAAVTLFDFRGVGVATVYYDSGIGTVFFEGAGESTVGIGTEAPSDPNSGDLWYNITDGRTYVYYDESIAGVGTARFWIDASPFNVGEIDIVNINADSLTISGASTVGNFVSSGTAELNNLSITGVSTIAGGVGFQADSNFTDNTKLTFGNSLDLRLYHDSTHSYVEDLGSGNLRLKSNGAGVEIVHGTTTRFISSTAGNNLSGDTTNHGGLDVTGVSTFRGSINNAGSDGQINARNINSSGIATFSSIQANNLTVTGFFNVNEVTEVVGTKSSAGSAGDVEHDLTSAAIWYHTSIAGNFTVDLTNVPTTENRAIAVTLILDQGANGYIPNGFKIDGVAQVIKWQGGVQPTASTFNIDTMIFSVIRVDTNNDGNPDWIVLGQLTIFD